MQATPRKDGQNTTKDGVRWQIHSQEEVQCHWKSGMQIKATMRYHYMPINRMAEIITTELPVLVQRIHLPMQETGLIPGLGRFHMPRRNETQKHRY